MIYQGSKARLIKDILPYIQNCIDSNKVNLYIEPFVGGANVIQHIERATKIGFDTNKYLIALLKHCQNNPDLTDAFEDCPFELYKEVRDSYNKGDDRYEDWQKGLVGFCASYGGRFFDGGYGRDKAGESGGIYKKRIKHLKSEAENLMGVSFSVLDYTTIDCYAEAVPAFFYLDPPYAGTKQYQNNFCHDQFYRWARELSKHHFVLISEYQMPSDFLSMWTKERKVMQKSDRASAELFSEHLFTHEDGLYYKWYHEEGYKLWQSR